ncbi:MAG: LysR family transcriptional regulator [Rhodospirillaceae bacterium]|nr:LysR family transcriptional regulator [Rhodospirillaceae bacterium]MBT4771836.1 LysR family transcriptional regulator [Rhodospirillaceae bacterium]MBT5358647.1 LysR family transcriptional regulator [Rhodospirillaceae bacterium]MBT5768731.1 LysR family transcriptional regulator [Rhodospirillaceae bacterium]MBT6309517.1 LysR family transcriptional regulator [Rhodospirillaceae bacterium]
MDWDKLRIFHAVADAGSFTHAGETLHLSQSAVSRQISSLEESLSSRLFHRHARGLILTEQGELLYRTVHDVFAKLTMVEARLTDSQEQPQGPLKIATTVGLGSLWLTPRITEFIEMYPDIEVNLITTDEELDVSMREADCAIRLTPPTQADLIQRRLTRVHTHVFASPEYLQNRGMPEKVRDLANHDLIVYGEDQAMPVANINWLLNAVRDATNEEPRKVLTLNNLYGMFRAVEAGVGVAGLPDFLAREAKNLVRILPELEGPGNDAFFVYPEEMRSSQRIAVFRDFLLRKVAETRF